MEQHIKRYTKYIHEAIAGIDIDTATYQKDLHKVFEWYGCINLSNKHKSINLLWEDVPPDLREQKNMPRDMGIDAWDIDGNRVSQMKLYQNTIPWKSFSTFLACCFTSFDTSAKILYRNTESQLHSLISSNIEQGKIIDVTVSDADFRNECKRIQKLKFPPTVVNDVRVIRHYQDGSITIMITGKYTHKNVYLCIPTGCGKTYTVLQYHLRYRSEKMLVLVPRVILMEQWGEECKKLGIVPYLIGTGKHCDLSSYDNESIVICVYDSFINIYEKKDRFERYIIDEAHHVKTPERYMYTEAEHDIVEDDTEDEIEDEIEEANNEIIDNESDVSSEEKEQLSYMKCIQSLSYTKKVVYISATLDEPNDDSLFYEYKIRQAIEERYLCDYQFIFPIFEQELVTNEQLAYYLVHKQNESHCVIYTPTCEEGKQFTKMLNDLRSGCAGYIDANTSYKERQRLFKAFEAGKIQFLVNIKVLVEGFDAPHIRSIFFLHISSSEIFIIQAIGRAMRLHPDKIIATIYVPFTQESDLERIQTFIAQISTYDERVKKSMDEKKVGGYINIVCGEDKENEEDEEDDDDEEIDVFKFRYNLIVDSMGKCDKVEEIWNKNLERIGKHIEKYHEISVNKTDYNWIKRQQANYNSALFIMHRESTREKLEQFIAKYKIYFCDHPNIGFWPNITKWNKILKEIEKDYYEYGKRPSIGSNNKVERTHAKWISHQKDNYKYKNDILKHISIRNIWDKYIKKYKSLIYVVDKTLSGDAKLKILVDYINTHNKLPHIRLKLENGFNIGQFTKCIFAGSYKDLVKPYLDNNPLLKEGYDKFHEKNNNKDTYTVEQRIQMLLKYVGDNKKHPPALTPIIGAFWAVIKSNMKVNKKAREKLLKNEILKKDYDKAQLKKYNKTDKNK